MCAKHYENLTMLSKVTAKNVGMFFLRHTVYAVHMRQKQAGIKSTELYNTASNK